MQPPPILVDWQGRRFVHLVFPRLESVRPWVSSVQSRRPHSSFVRSSTERSVCLISLRPFGFGPITASSAATPRKSISGMRAQAKVRRVRFGPAVHGPPSTESSSLTRCRPLQRSRSWTTELLKSMTDGAADLGDPSRVPARPVPAIRPTGLNWLAEEICRVYSLMGPILSEKYYDK
jgi:hypothetical protein